MVYIGIIAVIVLADALIKRRMEKKKPDGEMAFGGKLRLKLHHNTAAIFDSLQAKQTLVFSGAAVLTALLTLWFVCTLGTKGQAVRKAGLACLLGGAYGNTYERLYRKYVTDYFSFRTGIAWFDQIIFNLSDLAIMIGAVLVVIGAKKS
jgi:signal peptidase II